MSNRPTPSVRASTAFTLIEVIAVIVVVALLAGLAGLSLKGVLRRANGEQVVRRVLAYDDQARRRAERFDRAVRLDIRQGRIEQIPVQRPEGSADRDALPMWSPPLVLPAGWAIDRVVSAEGVDTRQEVVIAGTSGDGPGGGRSRSYGLRVVDAEGQHRWVIVCGPTGMGTVVDDDRQAEDILAILAQARLSRPDAD